MSDADFLPLMERQLRTWVPPGFAVVAAQASEDRPVADAERALVTRAVPHRRAEFIGGRWCAHEALRAIGKSSRALLPGTLGALQWPAGTIGSITHDQAWCCAVAGTAGHIQGVGLDLCAAGRRTAVADIEPMLLADAERAACDQAHDRLAHLHMLFCAKEAVVKAISALAGRFLDLREIAVALSADTFGARVDGLPFYVQGRHTMLQGHALALAWCTTSPQG